MKLKSIPYNILACVCNLAEVAKNCERNAPGLRTTVYLACVDDVSSIGAATAHVVSTITMVTDKLFYPIAIIRKDNDLKTTEQEDGGYNTELKVFISKKKAAKAAILTSMSSDENYIALVVDQNGYVEILGSLEHPIKVRKNSTVTPKNGYELTGLWEGHGDFPYSFSGDISALLS